MQAPFTQQPPVGGGSGMQFCGLQSAFANQVPPCAWQATAVTRTGVHTPATQQPPVAGAQFCEVHSTPSPSHVPPTLVHSSCVTCVGAHAPRMQQPPVGGGRKIGKKLQPDDSINASMPMPTAAAPDHCFADL